VPDKAPPKKPKRFKPMLDMLNTEAAVNTLAPKTFVDLVGMFSQKAYENGELSVDEYLDIVKPLFGETGEMVTNKIKEYEDELERYATGGRVNFLEGGDTEYNAMVTAKYIELGGKEGTGMDIDSFAKEYFPKFADGGRVNFFKGAVASGENISPGTSTTGSVRNDNPFTGGGRENNNPILEKIQKANLPDKSPFKKFVDHDRFTDQLKFNRATPNYHQLGGLDFMARFPGTNPNLAKFLARGYQYVTEGARALTNEDINFEDAMNKAKEETRLNNIGIDDFFNPESETYRQYKNLVPETGAVQMAEGGRAQFGDGTGTLDTPELLASDSDSDLIKSGKFARIVRLLMDEGFEFGEAVKEAMRQGYGTMPKSEKWMRDYFFSGKGGYDDRMSYKEFALGPGQELFKRFGND
jgi:hypothetical protein